MGKKVKKLKKDLNEVKSKLRKVNYRLAVQELNAAQCKYDPRLRRITEYELAVQDARTAANIYRRAKPTIDNGSKRYVIESLPGDVFNSHYTYDYMNYDTYVYAVNISEIEKIDSEISRELISSYQKLRRIHYYRMGSFRLAEILPTDKIYFFDKAWDNVSRRIIEIYSCDDLFTQEGEKQVCFILNLISKIRINIALVKDKLK